LGSYEPKAFTVKFHDGNERIIDFSIEILVIFCLKLRIIEIQVVSTSDETIFLLLLHCFVNAAYDQFTDGHFVFEGHVTYLLSNPHNQVLETLAAHHLVLLIVLLKLSFFHRTILLLDWLALGLLLLFGL
jgi:hypothetical protein